MTCSNDPGRRKDAHSFILNRSGEYMCTKCYKSATAISFEVLHENLSEIKRRVYRLETHLKLPPLGTLPPPKDPVEALQDYRTEEAKKAVEKLIEERRKFEELDPNI